MKVDTRVLDVTTTLKGEKIGMTIDDGALAHIMSILTDLYSDPKAAVLREYSTNAFDAHIEADVKRPIEVTLPSPLAPFLRIRDFGEGLDADGIRDTYSRYGASTKRESNEVVGMLGLGCKSALTYTDQFTLVGIKDGLCTQVSISRDEDGSGSMTVIPAYATDEPSGVEVIIPTKLGDSFTDEANHFFRFWQEGTVLVNGAEPKKIQGTWLDTDLLLTDAVDEDYLVMGNVAYPAGNNYDGTHYNTVAFVPIGSMNFTPSREAVQWTAKSKATLHDVRARMKQKRDAAIMAEIKAAPSKHEALVLALDAPRKGYKGTATWHDQEVPLNVKMEDDANPFVVVSRLKWHRSKGWGTEKVLSGNTMLNSIWLTGFEGDSFSPYKRKKVEQWAVKNGIHGNEHYILVDKMPQDAWVDPTKIHSWSGPDAEKIVREKGTSLQNGRPSGAYTGYVDGVEVNVIQAEDIDLEKPLFFAPQTGFNYHYERKVLSHNLDEFTFIIMTRNRINKFKRDFPEAVSVREYCMSTAGKWKDSLTSHELITLRIKETHEGSMLRTLDPAKVDDPELREGINLAKAQITTTIAKREVFGRWVELPHVKWSNPLDKYPLTAHLSSGSIRQKLEDHVYLYINAAYAAGQEN